MSKLVIDTLDLNYFGEYTDEWEDLAKQVVDFVKEQTKSNGKRTVIIEVV